MKTFKVIRRKGVDDLQVVYAFVGNSQGDEIKTNSIEEYTNSEGWLSYVFNVELTAESIEAEVKKRIEENKLYILKLEKEGKYGEEFEFTVHIEENPLFDHPNKPMPLESYRMLFVDLEDYKAPD